MKKFLLVITILFPTYIFSQSYCLNDFKVDSIPNSDIFKNAIGNNERPTFEKIMKQIREIERNSWKLEKINDSIKISPDDFNRFKGDSLPFNEKQIAKKIKNYHSIRAVKKVSNGYILGLNNGEFGGGLYFLSTNGKVCYEIESGTRVNDIFNFNSRFYVIVGLAHGGFSYGRLLEIEYENRWKISKSFRLPGAPRFIVYEKENFLILTSEHLLSFDINEKLNEILKAPFYWGMFYPSSAIVDSNDIYIAMRNGILKITEFKSNQNFEWLVKK